MGTSLAGHLNIQVTERQALMGILHFKGIMEKLRQFLTG